MGDALNCEQCGRAIAANANLYDDRTEHYFCDDGCLRDWLNDHFDEVVAWYKRMNITED